VGTLQSVLALGKRGGHTPGKMLIPSTHRVFAAAEDFAAGTVYMEMGHLPTSREMEKSFLKVHSVGTRQPCWSFQNRVCWKKLTRGG